MGSNQMLHLTTLLHSAMRTSPKTSIRHQSAMRTSRLASLSALLLTVAWIIPTQAQLKGRHFTLLQNTVLMKSSQGLTPHVETMRFYCWVSVANGCLAVKLQWNTVHTEFKLSQGQTQDVETMLFYRWATVCDAGPTLNQPWLNQSCVPGCDDNTAMKPHQNTNHNKADTLKLLISK